jgi:DNA replication and repair protein RecF
VILHRLRAAGWRNLEPADVRPGPLASVFFGQNGQGKTNLLESAYYATELRSFRTKTRTEIIRWGEPQAKVAAEVTSGGLDRRIDVEMSPLRKQVRVDGKAVQRLAPALRGLGSVVFLPEDLLLPRAPPSARRSFVDRAAYGANRLFYAEAVAYQKVLKNRNAVLRRASSPARAAAHDPSLLATYDEQTARTGARLVMRRRALVAALAPRVTELFVGLHADLQAEIRYRSDPSVEEASTEGEVLAALAAGLERTRDLDHKRRFTGFGPHTDDLEMTLAGRPVREHGSQGQLRSLVLALKLAELSHLESALGEPPLLLLDDVASELDEQRRRMLFETITNLSGQTFITVTDRGLIPTLPGRVDFEVSGGRITATHTA